MDAPDYPILAAHLATGAIYSDQGDYLGIAKDGVHVLMGSMGYEANLESYLENYPTPADW